MKAGSVNTCRWGHEEGVSWQCRGGCWGSQAGRHALSSPYAGPRPAHPPLHVVLLGSGFLRFWLSRARLPMLRSSGLLLACWGWKGT